MGKMSLMEGNGSRSTQFSGVTLWHFQMVHTAHESGLRGLSAQFCSRPQRYSLKQHLLLLEHLVAVHWLSLTFLAFTFRFWNFKCSYSSLILWPSQSVRGWILLEVRWEGPVIFHKYCLATKLLKEQYEPKNALPSPATMDWLATNATDGWDVSFTTTGLKGNANICLFAMTPRVWGFFSVHLLMLQMIKILFKDI